MARTSLAEGVEEEGRNEVVLAVLPPADPAQVQLYYLPGAIPFFPSPVALNPVNLIVVQEAAAPP